MAPTFDEVAKAKYILLTTFTKDGRPKPTPIWAAPDGDRLLVITARRLVEGEADPQHPAGDLAVCDMRGNPKSEAVDATATILDKSRNGASTTPSASATALLGKTFNLFSKLRGGMQKNVSHRIESGA